MDKIIRATSVVGSRRISERQPHQREQSDGDKRGADAPERVAAIDEHGEGSPATEEYAEKWNNDNKDFAEPYSDNYAEQVFSTDRQTQQKVAQENDELKQELSELKEQLKQTSDEMESLRQAKRVEGYEEGLKAGRLAASQEVEQRLSELQQLVVTFSQACETQILDLEDLAIEIGLAALCRIVEDKMADRAFVVATVKQVLAKVKDEPNVVVRVSPRQIALVRESEKEVGDMLQNRSFKLIPDSRVSLGGCLVETDGGNWDGRLETQLQRLIDLAQARERSSV